MPASPTGQPPWQGNRLPMYRRIHPVNNMFSLRNVMFLGSNFPDYFWYFANKITGYDYYCRGMDNVVYFNVYTSVLLFSKSNKMSVGFFDPVKNRRG